MVTYWICVWAEWSHSNKSFVNLLKHLSVASVKYHSQVVYSTLKHLNAQIKQKDRETAQNLEFSKLSQHT